MTMLQKSDLSKPETVSKPTLEESFFRSFARQVRTYKLGDLLVSSGLISPDQLDHALSQQKQNGGQLGAILIQQQALTAVQLYRKLAEQWCLKTAAAGVAIMVQVSSPTSAQASEVDAAAISHDINAHEATRYPELFGTHETRSEDTSAFKKWMVMIDRFSAPLQNGDQTSAGVAEWKREIASLQGLPRREQIKRVNDFLNNVEYVDDRTAYGEQGYWGASPERFFNGGGDCKDYAIAKYVSLRALGFADRELRVAIVQDKVKEIAHAILIFYSGDEGYVLDNQNKQIEPIEAVNRYSPYFSINQSAWWLHHA